VAQVILRVAAARIGLGEEVMASIDSPLTQPNPPNISDTVRLRGPWLTAIRWIWIVTAVAGVSLYIAAIPYRYNALNPDCQARPCSPEDQLQVSEIRRVGLSGAFVAWYFIVVDTFATVIYALTGALIFWRRSDDRVALFVSFMLLANGLTFGPEIFYLVQAIPALLPVFVPLQIAGYGFLIVFAFIFPDGRFVPRWTRWLALVFLAGQAFMLIRDGSIAYGSSPLYFGYLLAGDAIGVGAQIYRYRRVSTPAQRQQTKWVMLGGAGMLTLIFVGIFPSFFNPALLVSDLPYRMMRVPLFGALPSILLPIAIMFSMLRYRLWDVDFIINRSLVYGALSAVLALVFFGGFFALRAIFESVLGGRQSTIAIAAATAIVVLLFNPVRRRVRGFVDRRFYNIHIEYTPSPAPVVSGGARTTFGAYRGLELLGRGGMAEVYRAAQPATGKTVAVKIMSTALSTDAEFRKRFEREVKTVVGLKHPNIIQVFDSGEAEGTPYMVMEYLGGGDLGARLHAAGKMRLAEGVRLIQAIASALDYAHQQGLVHRDIKPSNVMLDGTRPVLTDFGIAKLVGGHTRFTQTGGMLGTFDYIAPEQIQGAANVDGRADIYALGVMVYQMLTGELPFKHQNSGALLIAHLTQPPPDAREITPDLARETAHAIQRAMAKKPEERFARAGEFAAALV
jgi:hypothetical protein